MLNKLNKNLFWDINFKELDYKKNVDFIIERVLNFGDEKDFYILKKNYSLKKIKNIAKKSNYSNKKTINFWSLIFNIPLKSFLCIKKLSTTKPSAFYSR